MAGNQILKVENSKMKSRLISRRASGDEHFDIHRQMDSVDEQIFIFLPFEVVISDPVTKGKQVDFIF